MRSVFLSVAMVVTLTSVAYADMVRWTDETGAVHYTDDWRNVPVGSRDSITPIDDAPPRQPNLDPTLDAFVATPATPGGPPAPIVYEAKLIPHGFSYYVDAMLNVNVPARLLLDTGATFTIVSPAVGRQMGYTDLKELPKMPVSTAGGGSWVYLIRIRRLAAGSAEVQDVEGGISETLGEGMDGLLGGSFLNEFVYQIDGSGEKLTLKPNRVNKELYGGRDQKWWETKYGHYVRAIRHYRELKRKMEKGVTAVEDSDLRGTVGLTPADMRKIVAYYEDLHLWLERRAILAGVPKEWRRYP